MNSSNFCLNSLPASEAPGFEQFILELAIFLEQRLEPLQCCRRPFANLHKVSPHPLNRVQLTSICRIQYHPVICMPSIDNGKKLSSKNGVRFSIILVFAIWWSAYQVRCSAPLIHSPYVWNRLACSSPNVRLLPFNSDRLTVATSDSELLPRPGRNGEFMQIDENPGV